MQRTILIADDDLSIWKLYERELSREGYNVLWSANGSAAIQLVRQAKADLVILDIRMPGMDGIEVLGRIAEEHPGLPVIINSSYASYKESFLSWVADAYLLKSSDLSELKATIRSLLARGDISERDQNSDARKDGAREVSTL